MFVFLSFVLISYLMKSTFREQRAQKIVMLNLTLSEADLVDTEKDRNMICIKRSSKICLQPYVPWHDRMSDWMSDRTIGHLPLNRKVDNFTHAP